MQNPGSAKDANGSEILELGALLDTLPENSQVKSALKAAIGGALPDARDIEKRVGDWFDDMMQRATGAYKRWMNVFSLLLGLTLAVAFNCDTIHFADSVAKSPALRAQIIKVAEDVTKRCAGGDDKPGVTEAECSNARRNLDALQTLPIGGSRNITFYAIAGWLITGFAVSLGAPFWFDLLSKFMNVRSSFKAQEQSAKTDSN